MSNRASKPRTGTRFDEGGHEAIGDNRSLGVTPYVRLEAEWDVGDETVVLEAIQRAYMDVSARIVESMSPWGTGYAEGAVPSSSTD